MGITKVIGIVLMFFFIHLYVCRKKGQIRLQDLLLHLYKFILIHKLLVVKTERIPDSLQ